MKEWDGNCQHCGKKSSAHIMSMFNKDLICFDCKKKEMEHPLYEEAREAEAEACRRGDYNFPGIGRK